MVRSRIIAAEKREVHRWSKQFRETMVYNESPEIVVSVDHMKKSKVSGDYQLTDFFRSKYHGFHDSLVLIIARFFNTCT